MTAARDRRALALVLAALTLWGAAFVWLNRMTIDGTVYWFLFDDALISMAYARDVVEGFGLNWARFGEPVEGFTNLPGAMTFNSGQTLESTYVATA